MNFNKQNDSSGLAEKQVTEDSLFMDAMQC